MENDLQRRLVSLKVLEKLSPGDYLRTRGRHFQIEPSDKIWAWRAFSRWWTGESRTQMTDDITVLVRQCLRDASNSNTSEQEQEQVLRCLNEATNGIRELINIYRVDALIASRLELVVLEIDNAVSARLEQTDATGTEQLNEEDVDED